jgi:hypothetical protein
VAITGDTPLLTAVNDAIFPEPLAASPIDVVLLVHVKPVVLVPVNVIAAVLEPAHTIWFVLPSTVAVGVASNVNSAPFVKLCGQFPLVNLALK